MPETTTAGDWRAAHRSELLEKQRHIRQKLTQVRQIHALVEKWLPMLRQYRDWFTSLEQSASASKYFSVQSLIRMAAITGHLSTLQGEFAALDRAAGHRRRLGAVDHGGRILSRSRDGTRARIHDCARHQDQTTPAHRAAAGLRHGGDVGPRGRGRWPPRPHGRLVHFIDPETSVAVQQGEYGVAITNILCSPFTSLAAVGFAEEIWNLSKAMLENHAGEFDKLEQGWNDTENALDDIVEALEGVDTSRMPASSRKDSRTCSASTSRHMTAPEPRTTPMPAIWGARRSGPRVAERDQKRGPRSGTAGDSG